MERDWDYMSPVRSCEVTVAICALSRRHRAPALRLSFKSLSVVISYLGNKID